MSTVTPAPPAEQRAAPPGYWLGVTVLACFNLAALLPEIPLAGSLGADDLPGLLALLLATPLILRSAWRGLDPVLVLLFLFLVLGVVANAAAVDPQIGGFLRGPVRTLFCIVAVLAGRALRQQAPLERSLAHLSWGAALVALFGIVTYALDYTGPYGIGVFHGENPLNQLVIADRGRLVGSFNMSDGRGMNFAAAYFMIMTPVALLASSAGRGRMLFVGAAVLCVVALALTYTRAALLALVVATVLAAIVAGRLWLVPAVAAACAVVLLSAPMLLQRFLTDANDRPALLAAAFNLWSLRPWVGHGDVDYVSMVLGRSDFFMTPFGAAGTSPHNSVALSAFRYGVAGAFVCGALLLAPIVHLARLTRRSVGRQQLHAAVGLLIFTAFAIQSMSNNLLEVPKVAQFYFLLWGLFPPTPRT